MGSATRAQGVGEGADMGAQFCRVPQTTSTAVPTHTQPACVQNFLEVSLMIIRVVSGLTDETKVHPHTREEGTGGQGG
jgi:hypothetical protein